MPINSAPESGASAAVAAVTSDILAVSAVAVAAVAVAVAAVTSDIVAASVASAAAEDSAYSSPLFCLAAQVAYLPSMRKQKLERVLTKEIML